MSASSSFAPRRPGQCCECGGRIEPPVRAWLGGKAVHPTCGARAVRRDRGVADPENEEVNG